jgi:hypothetical protein
MLICSFLGNLFKRRFGLHAAVLLKLTRKYYSQQTFPQTFPQTFALASGQKAFF